MRKDDFTNESVNKERKMTLRDYFLSLPSAKQIAPRNNLIREVAERCGVSLSAARAWLAYGCKPRKREYIIALSEITGISEEDLFEK